MSGRRIETTTSRTAAWTCVSRAASSLESDDHYRSDDHIALLLVPTFLKLLLHIPLVRRFYSQVLAPKGIYEYTIARTKYIDAVFKEILAEGFDQILIFGAGFDTRALRFEAEAGDTRIFELDVPITQQAKLEQYAQRGLGIPANVEFISIDFDRESLPEKLEEAGFGKGGRSLFVLEGLLMYLQPESVNETFKVIEEFAGEGSEVVFDYVRASVLRQAGSYYGEREIWFDHPDGPKFVETHRDAHRSSGHWLFLPGVFSSFHKVHNNEELWLIHLGRLLVHVLDPDGAHHVLRLGTDLVAGERPVVTVPANYWQAAEIPEGTPFAFGTNVCAPTYSYEEFSIARRQDLLRDFPDHTDLITRLTRDD